MTPLSDPDSPPTRGEVEWHRMNLRCAREATAAALRDLESAWESVDEGDEIERDGIQ